MMDDLFGLTRKANSSFSLGWLTEKPEHLLYAELYIAELQARKGGKRKTHDTHKFEVNLHENLSRLTREIWDYTYKPSRGTAHIIFDPVQREIFAAPYVDRVGHHFVTNSIAWWWEPRFCPGSCSCRVGKGTMYGVKLLDHYVRSASQNYKVDCVAIKMDIRGYFMHIDRKILWERVKDGLIKQFEGNYGKRFEILMHMCNAIIFDDPVDGVKIQGTLEDWRGLPADKSLFCQPPGQGLVIGNLTSQFFSNVYLDSLDHFITERLGFAHYVRYVDDFYIIVEKDRLKVALQAIEAIQNFLNGMNMSLNMQKTKVIETWRGLPFLGMVVKHGRIVPGKRFTNKYLHAAREVSEGLKDPESIVSYLGMLKHYDGEALNKRVFEAVGWEYSS